MSDTIATRGSDLLAFTPASSVAERLAGCKAFLKEEMGRLRNRHEAGVACGGHPAGLAVGAGVGQLPIGHMLHGREDGGGTPRGGLGQLLPVAERFDVARGGDCRRADPSPG